MADVDIDPLGDRESRPEEPTGENIPLTPVEGSTWEPECEQETSFGVMSQKTELVKDHVKDLYNKLSENIGETPEAFHFDYFKVEGGELYYRGKRMPLTTKGELRLVGMIEDILGKNGLRNLGFDIPRGKVTAREAVVLNKVKEELRSASDIDKADEMELQEITESAMKSTENLIAHYEGQETLPMCEILGLDKQLRSIRDSLKVEVGKKV